MYSTTLHPDIIEAIVGGYHADPFHVLGRHQVGDQWVVRVFDPAAESIIAIIEQEQPVTLTCTHPDGLYEGIVVEGQPYKLQITYPDRTILHADTYAMPSTLTDFDRYLLGEGADMRMYDKMGAKLMKVNGIDGTRFMVWAPNAERVNVIGNFNAWDGRCHPMRLHPANGLWELFIPSVGEGELYKYEIKTPYKGYIVSKADPVAYAAELRPSQASIVWDIDKYEWQDQAWLDKRAQQNSNNKPISIYELHLGSWQRNEKDQFLTYDELAERLIPYVNYMGYTHIELLPVSEHPLDASWGYQVTGYFAPTSRFGTPDQFQKFVDACHQANIGVIIDWVPAHFPKDEFGLNFFDGTHLYEHADPRQGEHPDWGTMIFNYGRAEVRQFLISNAIFWAEKYHIDGLRVDAVASMLYLDFSREEGQWIPNQHGGRENIEAIKFLREFNNRFHAAFPDVLTIAEESTSWGGVTSPPEKEGLGFDFKWNMGWMNDILRYMEEDPVYRSYHHGTLTFSMLYAFSEKFMLPFSHDEVVHGKGSMINKMPGDNWQKFANLRALYGYKYGHPGKKLMFMGQEFAQWDEWSEEHSLDWHLVQDGWPHKQMQDYVRDLNLFYRDNPALYEVDHSWEGFQWLSVQDNAGSTLAYLRNAYMSRDFVIVVTNFTPIVREDYRIGVPHTGTYLEVMNSDAERYGGSGKLNEGDLPSQTIPWQNHEQSINVMLPPLATIYIKIKL